MLLHFTMTNLSQLRVGCCNKSQSRLTPRQGCYSRQHKTDKLVKVKQQVIDYVFRTHNLQISLKLTHQKRVPDRQCQIEKYSTTLQVGLSCPRYENTLFSVYLSIPQSCSHTFRWLSNFRKMLHKRCIYLLNTLALIDLIKSRNSHS